jgi:HTH-type transcriptional regulator / antitoxin HigA
MEEQMTATAATTITYKQLLAEIIPVPIETEAQNDAALQKIEELMETGGEAEERLADLLTVLVEAFEKKHYPEPKVGPLKMLRHLMETQGLKQKDMLGIFGTPSIVSEVLNGKRKLTTEHIKKLSRRFHVSTDVFF